MCVCAYIMYIILTLGNGTPLQDFYLSNELAFRIKQFPGQFALKW